MLCCVSLGFGEVRFRASWRLKPPSSDCLFNSFLSSSILIFIVITINTTTTTTITSSRNVSIVVIIVIHITVSITKTATLTTTIALIIYTTHSLDKKEVLTFFAAGSLSVVRTFAYACYRYTVRTSLVTRSVLILRLGTRERRELLAVGVGSIFSWAVLYATRAPEIVRTVSNVTVLALCEGNPSVTGACRPQRTSNAGSVSVQRWHHGVNTLHYGEVIWARWRLKSPASPLFTQPFIRV